MFSRLGLILRTLPYLRWQQLVYRPIRLTQFRAYRAMPFLTKRWTASDKAIAEIPTSTLSRFRQVFDNGTTRDFAGILLNSPQATIAESSSDDQSLAATANARRTHEVFVRAARL